MANRMIIAKMTCIARRKCIYMHRDQSEKHCSFLAYTLFYITKCLARIVYNLYLTKMQIGAHTYIQFVIRREVLVLSD